MSEQDRLNPAERELEEALRSLAPTAAHVDPIGAAFEAGRRSTRRQVRLWRSATAASLVVLAVASVIPTGPVGVTRAPIIAEHAAPTSPHAIRPVSFAREPVAEHSLVMLQAAIREHGVSGLPATELPIVESRPRNDML